MTSRFPRTRHAALLVSLTLLLGACSDNDERKHVTAPPPPTGGMPPPVATDSFFTLVLARVASLLDNDEPAPIDGVTATTPETTEPEPLPPT